MAKPRNPKHLKRCPNARRYLGVNPPRCNKGTPCKACKKIYKEEQAKRKTADADAERDNKKRLASLAREAKARAKLVKEQALKDLLKDAKDAREHNADLVGKCHKDPGFAEQVKKLLILDLQRVGKIPRAILGTSHSRDRYRELGHFSTSLVTYVIGSWAEFKRQAGVEDNLAIKAIERKIGKITRAQAVASYAERYVKPYNAAFEKLDLEKDSLLIQIGSDFHYPFTDPFATRVWMDVAKKHKPDGVRYNGDGPDFPTLSRHRQLPGHFCLNLQQEITGWKKFMADTRAVTPDACHKWILGNHDIRLVYALAEAAPIYSTLESLEFNKLFDLDALEIGLVARNTFLNPTSKMKKTDIAQNWETIAGLFTIVHGFLCGKDAPDKHMARFMRYGTNGHLHDPKMVSGGSDATGVHQWWQTPCMAFPEAVAKEYMPGPIAHAGWRPGFLMARIFPNDGFVSANFVICEDVAEYGGDVWFITEDEREQRIAMLEI